MLKQFLLFCVHPILLFCFLDGSNLYFNFEKMLYVQTGIVVLQILFFIIEFKKLEFKGLVLGFIICSLLLIVCQFYFLLLDSVAEGNLPAQLQNKLA